MNYLATKSTHFSKRRWVIDRRVINIIASSIIVLQSLLRHIFYLRRRINNSYNCQTVFIFGFDLDIFRWKRLFRILRKGAVPILTNDIIKPCIVFF